MAMSNKSRKPQSNTSNRVVTVAVHGDAKNPTAFRLGFYHATEGVTARKRESFIYESTATSYSLGYMAGCAARAVQARGHHESVQN